MKKYKVTMLGTSVKEVYVSAKNEKEALDKVDKAYLDDEKIDFNDDDIIKVTRSCKEIISKRREKFTCKTYDIPDNPAVVFIEDLMDTFLKSDKKVCNGGYLQVNLIKDDYTRLEKLYDNYKKDIEA